MAVAVALASPLAAYLFNNFNSKGVLLFALFVNGAANLAFSLTPEPPSDTDKTWTYVFLGFRGLVGWSQAFLTIWAPTWIDGYAPPEKMSSWYAYNQAFVPFGVMCGYALGMILVFIGGESDSVLGLAPWRYPFFIQVIMIFPFFLYLCTIPTEHIDSKRRAALSRPLTRSNSADKMEVAENTETLIANDGFETPVACCGLFKALHQFNRCLFNPLFFFNALGVCGLLFVVTGIQYWATDFVITDCGGDKYIIMPLFIVTSCTAPIGGVLFGGWLIDRNGGYNDDRGIAKTLSILLPLGAVAVASAFPASFIYNPYIIFVLIWVCLFFGGAVLPAATGISLAVVREEDKNYASSLSAFMTNILGYAGAPFISSIVMEAYQSYRLGFRVVVSASFLSLFCMLVALLVAKRREKLSAEEDALSTVNAISTTEETIVVKRSSLSLDFRKLSGLGEIPGGK